MNAKKFSEAMSEVSGKYYEEAANYQRRRSRRHPWLKWGLAAACLALIIATGTAAVAAALGYDLLGWILTRNVYTRDPAVIQSQIDEGQWVYLNNDCIAVILPESPTKILLSRDGGVTWRESVVEGSDKMFVYGSFRENIAPNGGFIGFWGDGGYLVLTEPASMGNQPMRIYLTDDGGDTWSEIGNPYDAGEHYCVLTGAGFSTEEIGFISYRYYEDAGPDIWWTADGGDTWEELNVPLPEQYADGGYSFTPQSPVFNGPSGIYPIEAHNHSDGSVEMIYLHSDDYGLTWNFLSSPGVSDTAPPGPF